MNKAMVEHLGGHDPEFELRFIQLTIPHHEGMIAMPKHVLEHSGRPELKQMAWKSMEEKQKEIERLKTWREQRYGKSRFAGGAGLPTGRRSAGRPGVTRRGSPWGRLRPFRRKSPVERPSRIRGNQRSDEVRRPLADLSLRRGFARSRRESVRDPVAGANRRGNPLEVDRGSRDRAMPRFAARETDCPPSFRAPQGFPNAARELPRYLTGHAAVLLLTRKGFPMRRRKILGAAVASLVGLTVLAAPAPSRADVFLQFGHGHHGGFYPSYGYGGYGSYGYAPYAVSSPYLVSPGYVGGYYDGGYGHGGFGHGGFGHGGFGHGGFGHGGFGHGGFGHGHNGGHGFAGGSGHHGWGH